MNGQALAIIASCGAGAVLGFVAGVWHGERKGGDYNFAPAFYGPMGAVAGAVVGTVVGAVVFL